MKIVPKILERGIRVIDLSGDYRFDNVEVYEKWYGIKHEHPLDAVYGLPELYRDEIKRQIWLLIQDVFLLELYLHVCL